jgi:hypothetical protein
MYQNNSQSCQIVVDQLETPYADAYVDAFESLARTDVESGHVEPIEATDVDPNQVGDPVGKTANNQTVVAEEGDSALSKSTTLKDRKDSCIGPQWGDGHTTWHPRDIEQAPSDVDTTAAVSAVNSEIQKEWIRRFFGEGSYPKRLTDGTFDDDGGFRHENDVWLIIRAFCEQVGLNGYEGRVKKVYDELPPEPFQPIGGHESADCDIQYHRPHVITDVHPPQNGELNPDPNSECGWDVEFIKLPHDPTTCPRCDQCRCGEYHLGGAPTNGVETKVVGAMLLVDDRRIEAAEDSLEAYENRLQTREAFTELAENHAIDYSQARQTAIKHHERNN